MNVQPWSELDLVGPVGVGFGAGPSAGIGRGEFWSSARSVLPCFTAGSFMEPVGKNPVSCECRTQTF